MISPEITITIVGCTGHGTGSSGKTVSWTRAVRGLKTEFESWLSRETSNEQAKFGVRNGWITDDGIRIVDELVYVQSIRQKKPVPLASTLNYGQLMRMSPLKERSLKDMEVQCPAGSQGKEVICSPEGVHTDDELKTSFPWCDYAFVPKGKKVHRSGGFVSPLIRLSPDWLLRHYGYFGVCYPGMESVTLKKGTGPLIMDYRIWTHPEPMKMWTSNRRTMNMCNQ